MLSFKNYPKTTPPKNPTKTPALLKNSSTPTNTTKISVSTAISSPLKWLKVPKNKAKETGKSYTGF